MRDLLRSDSDSSSLKDENEWGEEAVVVGGQGSPPSQGGDNTLSLSLSLSTASSSLTLRP